MNGLATVSQGSCRCLTWVLQVSHMGLGVVMLLFVIALTALVILIEASWQACGLSLLLSVSITVDYHNNLNYG